MSKHQEVSLFDDICTKLNPTWEARGYTLIANPGGYDIAGDHGQFYVDAVSRHAQAHLGMEFLRLHARAAFSGFLSLAQDDGIDLPHSQKVFLAGQSLEAAIANLPVPM